MNTKESQEEVTQGPWKVLPSTRKGNGTGWRDIVSIGTDYSPSYIGEALEKDAALFSCAPELRDEVKHYRNLIKDLISKDEASNAKLRELDSLISRAGG